MATTLRIDVPASLAGLRVDRAIAVLTGLPRTRIAALIASGAVVADGTTLGSPSKRISEGAELSLTLPDTAGPSVPEPSPEIHLDVVYEDADIAVIDKHAGLVVHPGAGVPAGTLVNGLLARVPSMATLAASGVCDPVRPGIVHRLDKGTSGLMVVALSLPAYRTLSSAIAGREVRRGYRTLVWGAVSDDVGIVDAPVGRALSDRTLMAVTRSGRDAITRYRVDERIGPGALVEPVSLLTCELETGRTHQIRVHLAAIGHPVVGDDRYGGALTRRRDPERIVSLRRPFLHAFRLELDHPVTGEHLCFVSDLPDDLAVALAAVRTCPSSTA